jgi:hypothetical protein
VATLVVATDGALESDVVAAIGILARSIQLCGGYVEVEGLYPALWRQLGASRDEAAGDGWGDQGDSYVCKPVSIASSYIIKLTHSTASLITICYCTFTSSLVHTQLLGVIYFISLGVAGVV